MKISPPQKKLFVYSAAEAFFEVRTTFGLRKKRVFFPQPAAKQTKPAKRRVFLRKKYAEITAGRFCRFSGVRRPVKGGFGLAPAHQTGQDLPAGANPSAERIRGRVVQALNVKTQDG